MLLKKIALVVLFSALAQGQDLVIRNARVITCAGPDREKADIRVENGRIVEIGDGITAPLRTPSIDARGKVVMPAFVLAHTSEGLDRQNEAIEVVPFVSVLDSIDATRPFFDDCLRDGVYTINIMPADRTVFGGLGRILRPNGRVVEDMTIVPDSGMKISMIPPTGNRATHVAKIRATLDDARKYLERKLEDAPESKPSGSVRFDLEKLSIDRRKLALVRLLKREIPAYVACGEAGDVLRALEIIKEYGLDGRLVLMAGTWRAASAVAASKLPVIVAPEFEYDEQDPETGKMVKRVLPKALFDAGVEFAMTSRPTNLGQRYLWYQAAMLMRHGISRDVALRSVTITAAKALGLGAQKGTLEIGKDADILVLTADPLSGTAWVDTGIIDGKTRYDRKTDRKLKDVLGLGADERN